MSADVLKKEFVSKYLTIGEDRFYRFILVFAINKLISIENKSYKGMSPDLEFLDYHDRFIILYRREGDETYLNIAKIFRKAAHKTYRTMLKKNMTEHNAKFLNLV